MLLIKKIRIFICVIAAVFFLAAAASAPVYSEITSNSLQQVVTSTVDAVKPALVRIMVVSVKDYSGREVKRESFGSGIIIDTTGYVVTNHHIAGHAKQIKCTMADKSEINAQLIGTDPATDIAVIKLMPAVPTEFPVAKFGDSSQVKVGDTVMAMGSPLAFSQSVTMGIISNTELVMPEMLGGLTLDGEDVGSLVRWIAHDSFIISGNSGGPLINIKGEVIGINEIQIGLGGAIPSNLAKEVADEIIRNGKVTRSWLGLTIQPLLKQQKNINGVLIGSTVIGSPAEAAGIKSGDILTKLAGQDVSVKFKEELPLFNQYTASLKIGETVDAVVIRDREEITLKITPAERQSAIARPVEFTEWGLCASDITFFAAKEMKRNQSGVLVKSIREGGPASNAKPRITSDDVIVKINGNPVNSIDDLKNITNELLNGKSEPVPTLVEYDRNASHFITVVNVGIPDLIDSGLEVKKAWIPIDTQVLTRDIADALQLGDKTGVRVTQVYKFNDKDETGLKVGDIIYKINDSVIEASIPEDIELFPTMVRQYKVGSIAKLVVLRDGKEITVSTTLQQSPLLVREMKKYKDEYFDFTVRDISFFDKIKEQWTMEQTGVLVESVEQGGWASLGELLNGDLIIEVDNNHTPDIESFQTQMKRIETEHPASVVFKIKNGIHEMYKEIEPSWTTK